MFWGILEGFLRYSGEVRPELEKGYRGSSLKGYCNFVVSAFWAREETDDNNRHIRENSIIILREPFIRLICLTAKFVKFRLILSGYNCFRALFIRSSRGRFLSARRIFVITLSASPLLNPKITKADNA